MATILNIDTSTQVCSVALCADGQVIDHHENYDGMTHSTLLSAFIESCMKRLRLREQPLDAVAVSIGPGSYTGLRIGMAEAKGLAFGLNVPLIGVNTLKLLAVTAMFRDFLDDEDGSLLLAPMLDARRMEVYTAVYDFALNERLEPQPMIIDENSFAGLLEDHKLLFMGNGSDKARDVITHPNAAWAQGIKPVAVNMTALSEKAFREKDFIDTAYASPLYLKEYLPTKSRKRLF